jgi:hypothetical protein
MQPEICRLTAPWFFRFIYCPSFFILKAGHTGKITDHGRGKLPGFKIERPATPGEIILPVYIIVNTFKAVYFHLDQAPLQLNARQNRCAKTP